jgi:hypothetical protein
MPEENNIYRIVHPNSGMLYLIAFAVIIGLGLYYFSQTYLIEEETREFVSIDPTEGNTITNSQTNNKSVPFNNIIPPVSEWVLYQNTQHDYAFRYPAGHTVFGDVDVKNEILIPAPADSGQVSIAEFEPHVFCCEPTTFSIKILNSNESPRAWLDKNFGDYAPLSEITSIEDVTFSDAGLERGNMAGVVMTGSNNIGSTHKLYVLRSTINPPRPGLFVINISAKSDMLEMIWNSLIFDYTRAKR